MAAHSSILAWRVPWTEEPGGLQSKRVAKSQSRLSTHARIAALQRGGGFCCTTKQISHTYTCIRSFFGLSSHLGHQRVLGRVPCAVQQFSSVISFIPSSVCMSVLISQSISSPLPPVASILLFSTSVSLFLLCIQVHQYRFYRFYIYALIYSICFSLSSFCMTVFSPFTSLQIAHFPMYFKSSLLRDNSHTINLSINMYKSVGFSMITGLGKSPKSILEHFHDSKKKSQLANTHNHHHPQPQTTTNLLCISVYLPILPISYK